MQHGGPLGQAEGTVPEEEVIKGERQPIKLKGSGVKPPRQCERVKALQGRGVGEKSAGRTKLAKRMRVRRS